MAGKKVFSGGLPKTTKQRSGPQVAARLEDLLDYINEFFEFTGDASNYGKVFGVDGVGNIDVKTVLSTSNPIEEDKILIGNSSGDLVNSYGVTGIDKRYKIGPNGSQGQVATLDSNGDIVFETLPTPQNLSFEDKAGNFQVESNGRYNIDEGANISIDSTDVVAGFSFRFRPKNGVDFTSNNPILVYNGTNAFESYTEDVEVDINAEYEVYTQDGNTLKLTARKVSV